MSEFSSSCLIDSKKTQQENAKIWSAQKSVGKRGLKWLLTWLDEAVHPDDPCSGWRHLDDCGMRGERGEDFDDDRKTDALVCDGEIEEVDICWWRQLPLVHNCQNWNKQEIFDVSLMSFLTIKFLLNH